MLKRFVLLFVALSCLLFLIAACVNQSSQPASAVSRKPASIIVSGNATTTLALVAQGTFAAYPLPQDHSSIMRPAIDHEGRIWFGEMGHNYLACFDPRSRTFQQMTPPQGANGIMGIAVAADDTIWFAEQYANYIGHYFPSSGQYQIYPLPVLHKPDPGNPTKMLSLPSAPNDIVLDRQGNVWFTEMNADAIGVLHVKTGQFTHYPLSSPPTIQKYNPYGITIDPQGSVWFTEASNSRLGRLDPQTGGITYYQSSDVSEPLMEVASDAHGNIWATSFSGGLLLAFHPANPAKEQFTTYIAPDNGTHAGGIYGLTITPDNEIWVALTSASVIARFDTRAHRFLYYQIPGAPCLPFGIAANSDHTLWFTESGTDKIGSLRVAQ